MRHGHVRGTNILLFALHGTTLVDTRFKHHTHSNSEIFSIEHMYIHGSDDMSKNQSPHTTHRIPSKNHAGFFLSGTFNLCKSTVWPHHLSACNRNGSQTTATVAQYTSTTPSHANGSCVCLCSANTADSR